MSHLLKNSICVDENTLGTKIGISVLNALCSIGQAVAQCSPACSHSRTTGVLCGGVIVGIGVASGTVDIEDAKQIECRACPGSGTCSVRAV